MKKNKTPEYTKKAQSDYMERNNYINFSRRIKPEWRPEFIQLLEKKRKDDKQTRESIP